jgi:CRISPR-associated protein Cmr5
MNKRIIKLIPKAIEAVTQAKIPIKEGVDKGKIPKAFNGYISSLGASIITSGILPTLIFYGDKAASQADRPAIIHAIEIILGKGKGTLTGEVVEHYKGSNQAELARLTSQITDAAIALKLAIRTFPKQEKN